MSYTDQKGQTGMKIAGDNNNDKRSVDPDIELARLQKIINTDREELEKIEAGEMDQEFEERKARCKDVIFYDRIELCVIIAWPVLCFLGVISGLVIEARGKECDTLTTGECILIMIIAGVGVAMILLSYFARTKEIKAFAELKTRYPDLQDMTENEFTFYVSKDARISWLQYEIAKCEEAAESSKMQAQFVNRVLAARENSRVWVCPYCGARVPKDKPHYTNCGAPRAETVTVDTADT